MTGFISFAPETLPPGAASLSTRFALSKLVTGNRDTVAVRVTKHEGVRRICALLGYPLISTSANFSGEEPLRTYEDTVRVLGDLVDYVVPGETMRLRSPSTVIDGMTGKILRN